MAQHLTAVEAAARLGIKRESLYAYVSRGMLDRTLSLDGRSSLFDADQIDRLRRSRRRPASGELRTVITTSITELDESGHRYRGIAIQDLTDASFEDVADQIWQQSGTWVLDPALAKTVQSVMRSLPPDIPVIDRHRITIALASGADPMRHNPSPAAHAQAGRSMIGAIVQSLGDGAPDDNLAGGSVAARVFRAVSGHDPKQTTVTPEHRASREQAVNLALVLLADHGLAASTFSARIAASVRADPYSVVAAGMGPVGGLLHGAASLGVHRIFEEAARIGVEAALGQQLAEGGRHPGVGHTIYKTTDPREVLLTEALQKAWADDPRRELIVGMRSALRDRIDLVTNVDFALGALTFLMRADESSGEALFALARIVGWVAHGIEELGERPIRFRPTARFIPSVAPDTFATFSDPS